MRADILARLRRAFFRMLHPDARPPRRQRDRLRRDEDQPRRRWVDKGHPDDVRRWQ